MEVFLYNSTVCRLCGEENDNGSLLYSSGENNQTLSEIVNAYLPIKVSDDGQLPRTICPGCTIQLEATVEFLNLIIKGQKILRELYSREKEYKKNIFSSPKEPEIITENIVYEINTSDGVYQVEHPIALQVGGLEKPKRKRGRPPKKPKSPQELAQEFNTREQEMNGSNKDPEEPSGKRKRKAPTRFKEVVQGKELDRIFKEEGVTDGEESDTDIKPDPEPEAKTPVSKEPEVIGHLEDSGELVVVVKGKGRGRPKGRMKQTRSECAICGMEFSCVGRYMSHVAQHGPVLYECAACRRRFATRLAFADHQRAEAHQGRNVIPATTTTEKAEVPIKSEPATESGQGLATDLAPVASVVTNVISSRSLPVLDPAPPDFVPDTVDQIEVVLSPVNSLKNGAESDNTNVENSEQQSEAAGPEAKPRLKCNHCDKTFSNKQSKSMHIKATHQGERAYACGECGARFAYPRSLALHAVSHRRHASGKGYACDLCGKVLNHPSSVVYHKEAEHAGQRYVCNKCGKAFKHKQLLQRHQLVHSQHRPYVCKTCNASFKTKANLINHQLLHSGVKKFSCEICKHKFAHKTSLTLHMRWHTGQKPFSCGVCGKSFSQKGNLSEHERIHTGEKPYACARCPRRFTTSSQHRLHARRHQPDAAATADHHPNRLVRAVGVSRRAGAGAGAGAGGAHVCAACGSSFAERGALARHARRHRADTLPRPNKQTSKQISLLVDKNPPAEEGSPEVLETEVEQDGDMEESVIYVTYDVDDASESAFTILDPEQAERLDDSKVVTTCELFPPLLLPPAPPATEPAPAPLQLTMPDGTRLALASLGGRELRVLTQDGRSIPVEITRLPDDEEVESEETVVHQLDLQKTVESNDSGPVTHYFTIV